MQKYDDNKVECLLNWIDQCKLTSVANHPIFEDTLKAREALRPKPEMEYVLPEWMDLWLQENITTHTSEYNGIPRAATFSGSGQTFTKNQYNAIRNATRIPARPKVLQGNLPDIPTDEDVLFFRQTVHDFPSLLWYDRLKMVLSHLKKTYNV